MRIAKRIHTLLTAGLLLVMTLGMTSLQAEISEDAGGKLFKQNCSTCHKVDKPMTGPALKGIGEKYANDKEWLYKWIRNSQGLIKAGDPKAVKLYEENQKKQMNAFPTLSDDEIESILLYVENWKPAVKAAAVEEGATSIWEDKNLYYAMLLSLIHI